MKKKFITVLFIMALLTALTEYYSKKVSREENRLTEESNVIQQREAGKDLGEIPKDTPVIAPPIDADGNLPENFDSDGYFDGFVNTKKDSG